MLPCLPNYDWHRSGAYQFSGACLIIGDCPRHDSGGMHCLEGKLNMSLDTQCIDTMLSAWNSHDEDLLGQIVEKSLSPDLEFCDPFHDICGHEPFIKMVKAFWAKHGHCKITRTSGIDAHHNRARYSWLIEAPSGGRFEGFDTVTLDISASKVRRVDGFFGPLSPV